MRDKCRDGGGGGSSQVLIERSNFIRSQCLWYRLLMVLAHEQSFCSIENIKFKHFLRDFKDQTILAKEYFSCISKTNTK